MSARTAHNRCIALALTASIFCPTTNAAASDEDHEVLTELFSRWQAFRSDIATARLTYRSFHNSLEGQKSLAEFDALIDRGELDSSPYGMQRFIESMNGGPYRVNPPWGEGTIIVRDRQRRNDLGPFVTIDDRDLSLFYDSLNQQYDAFTAGGSNRRPDSLETFRPLPPEPWSPDRWQVTDRNAATIRLSRLLPKPTGGPPDIDARSYEVERSSGVISRIARSGPDGKIVSAARYLEIAELPGGVTFPRIAVEIVLKDDVVTVMHLCVIDRIEINIPIEETQFHLPASANSKIVDHRGPSKSVTRLKQDQPDIAGWLKTHAPASPIIAARIAVDHTVRNVLLTGNGLLLIVVGLVYWKRNASSRPHDALIPHQSLEHPK